MSNEDRPIELKQQDSQISIDNNSKDMVFSSIPENVDTVSSKSKYGIILLILFLILTTGAAAYFGYNFMRLQSDLKDKKEMSEDTNKTETEDISNNKSNSGGLGVDMDDEVEVEDENIIINEVDDIWNEYINRNLGFSIKYPKQASYYYGDCQWQDDSYRPVADDVPINITEADNGIYIHFSYRKELLEPETVDGFTNYGDCQRRDNDLNFFEQNNQSWHIVTAEVTSENELEGFIQDRFGTGCGVGDQIPTDNELMMEVRVETDGLSMEESQCVMNYMYEIRYVPEYNKVFTWNIGQSCNFPADESHLDCYDQEMINSFEVIME